MHCPGRVGGWGVGITNNAGLFLLGGTVQYDIAGVTQFRCWRERPHSDIFGCPDIPHCAGISLVFVITIHRPLTSGPYLCWDTVKKTVKILIITVLWKVLTSAVYVKVV